MLWAAMESHVRINKHFLEFTFLTLVYFTEKTIGEWSGAFRNRGEPPRMGEDTFRNLTKI
jgi:hypothetical protein